MKKYLIILLVGVCTVTAWGLDTQNPYINPLTPTFTNITISGLGYFANGTATDPSITFTDDDNTGIYRVTSDQIGFTADGEARLIVTDDPHVRIFPYKSYTSTFNSTGGDLFGDYTMDDLTVDELTASYGTFSGSTTVKSLDIGDDTHQTMTVNGTVKTFDLSIHGNDTANRYVAYMDRASSSHSPTFVIVRASGTHASPALVTDGMVLGQIEIAGWDGTDAAIGAQIRAVVDGTPGSDDMPTALLLRTSTDGTQDPVTRIKIAPNGDISYHPDTAYTSTNTASNGNLDIAGDVTANAYYGDGSNLTGISASGSSSSTLKLGGFISDIYKSTTTPIDMVFVEEAWDIKQLQAFSLYAGTVAAVEFEVMTSTGTNTLDPPVWTQLSLVTLGANTVKSDPISISSTTAVNTYIGLFVNSVSTAGGDLQVGAGVNLIYE